MTPNPTSAPFMPPISPDLRQHNLLLFGDLTATFTADLRQLLHVRTNGTLQQFFETFNLALRRELDVLPAEQREWLPRFTDLIDLLPLMEGCVGSPAMKSALLCVYQIGRFINGDSYPSAGNSHVMGVCTGSFAAAAVASSRTMKDLVTTGTEAAVAAFRTGWHSLLLQRDIELSSKPWSFVTSLSAQKAQDLLQKFNAEAQLPTSSQAYLSAVSTNTVTISGPPHHLERLVELFALKAHFIEIQGPYHASHLNGASEVEQILGDLCKNREEDFSLRIPLISASSGSVVEQDSFRGLLRRAIDDVLCRQIRWDEVAARVPALLKQREGLESCVVYPVASEAGSVVSSSVQKNTELSVTISNALNAEVTKEEAKRAPGKFADSKIAIIGYSGRYPEAASNEQLWEEVLMKAKNCYREIPADRFDWQAHYDAAGKKKNHSAVKYGCFVNEPGVFDARFFNLSPREAENTDPAQRLLLMATYEAMEMGGFVPDRTASTQRDRVGVFMGTTSDDWREVNSGQNIDTYFIPGGNRAFVPGRISYFFRFCGPAISVDTACSSSFAAISTACNYLWAGDCDSAIAGGTNVLTNPDNFVGLDRGHFLSHTGNCNPFDNSASGYCRADAVGSVILKRLDDAVADKDPIFGVIAGSNTNHCGQTVSITRPDERDQLALFRQILRHANQDPAEVGYVEMHGTGTQAGDAAEMRSVLSALAPDQSRRLPLHIGAIKANVGHAESASGVTALIKVLLMMKHSTIPPHRLDGDLNRNYPKDLAERKVGIAFKPTPWRREDAPGCVRRAFLNNFSAAGGNTAVLLEDCPPDYSGGAVLGAKDPRSVFPVAVSAKTPKALAANLTVLAAHIEQNAGSVSLPALSYTTTARRNHWNFRTIVSGGDAAAVVSALRRRADDTIKAVKPDPPKVAFAFTGQGVLYAGIGKALFESVATFRADILRFARIAELQGFPAFLPLINGELQNVDASTVEPVVAQLAVACVQMAFSHLWNTWIGAPSAVTGHSLGEYAALYSAGVLSASDTIYLVGSRAKLLTELCTKSTHTMLAVKAPLVAVAGKLSSTSCTVACINSPSDTVVSGPTEEIKTLAATCKADNIDSVVLDVPYAFHSAQVEPILERFTALGEAVAFNKPTVPYVSPLLSKVVTEAGVINAKYLAQAARESVNFLGALEAAQEAKLVTDTTPWIEIGAHPACAGMIKKTIGSQASVSPSLRKDSDAWKILASAFEALYHAGAHINWEEFHRGFGNTEVIPLPRYSWDLKNYWIQYKNNFCLTKGDDPPPAPVQVQQVETKSPVYISPSVQKVLEEEHGSDESSLLVESNVHDPRLLPMLEGHKVNGVSLCPSSLYADMALTIAQYLLEQNGTWTEQTGLDVSDVKADKPLIAKLDGPAQFVRMSATAQWSEQEIKILIFSADAQGKKVTDHGSAVVRVSPTQNWAKEWKRNAYLIRSRINALHQDVDSGNAHKMKRGMVYKLFGSLVDYARRYQGMEEVVLDSDQLEATAKVNFQVPDEGFRASACWIDSLGHIAGFIMNGNDNIHSKDHVFINHGWDRMRIAGKLEYGKTYTTYNRMQLLEGMEYSGDTFIFDENNAVVAVFEGVVFQGIPRRVLDRVLPPQGATAKAQPAMAAASKPAAPKAAAPKPAAKSQKAAPAKKPAAAPKISTAASSQKSSDKIAALVKAIISDECHMDIAEMGADTEFTDCGVDSLLSLTIAGRLQEELSLTVDPSVFTEYSTIGAFAKHVSGGVGPSAETEVPSGSSSEMDTPESPISDAEDYETDQTSIAPEDETDIMAVIKNVIAQETGAAIEEINPNSNLAEFGMDSLLSLTIMGVLGEVVDKKLPPNLLAENETLQAIENTLGMNGLLPPKYDHPVEAVKVSSKSAPAADRPVVDDRSGPQATSVLLRGSPKQSSKTLFLFPDGSGSAASYAAIPSIGDDVAVYGLNCPWLKTPQDLTCSMEVYAAKFVTEMRRRQAHGPYYLGGWSAGGIVAYEAAQQLQRLGETTERLILIDSPNPIGLENPPARMYDFFDGQGLFGEGGRAPPSWLRPHFTAFLTMLDNYKIQPFHRGQNLTTHIVYARDGLCKNPEDPRPEMRDDDPREMQWLLNNRTDFSASGWSQVVGKKNVSVAVLDDVNHFTLVGAGPNIGNLRAFIAEAIL